MMLNHVYNQECVAGMREHLEDNSIDCLITSPPYNVGVDYDEWDDLMPWEEYKEFMRGWLWEAYRVLKKDGRIALNVPYEINLMERGGRLLLVSEYHKMMQEVGFRFAGIVDLQEKQPHRAKLTAWGSWLSPSSPYIYNTKECIILAYKELWKKERVGESYFNDENKKEFRDLVYGVWEYEAEKRGLTRANFSYDLPLQALKILTFEGEIVLDPFMGSGTTAEACIRLNRKYVGFEISKKYCKIMKRRINQKRLSSDWGRESD